MNFLRFALQLIDYLAWPLLALGYPICASIRAIETGSKYHMRKLVIYWTIFSLISLFQHLFHNLIQWVPLWPHIKLITIGWLVIPHFDGACYLYEVLVRPCLLVKWHDSISHFNSSCYVYLRLLCLCLPVNLRTVANWFNKPMEDQSFKNETFLSVVERYLEENGSDALEKLIANKYKDCSSNHHVEEIKPTDTSDEAGRLTPNQTECEGSGPVWEDITVLEYMAKHEAAEPKQVKSVKENPIQIEKETTGVQVKELVVPADAEEIKLPEVTSSKKVPTEWTCALCQMTTTSEQNLKSHLNGRKHKANCEGLKTCEQTSKSDGSIPVPTKSNQLNLEQVKHAAAAQPEHSANGAAEPKQVKSVNENPIQIEKKTTGVQVKEMVVPAVAKEVKLPEVTSSKKVQTEWTCSLCQMTTTSEQNMKSHLNGGKHKAKCEGLKSCKQTSKSDGSSPVPTESNQLNLEQVKHATAAQSEHSANKGLKTCEQTCKSDGSLPVPTESNQLNLEQVKHAAAAQPEHSANEAAVPKQVKNVKEHPIQIEKKTTGVQIKHTAFPADAKEIKLPEINSVKNVQTKWTCAVCQVTTTSEHDLKCHLLGTRHREMREELKRTFKTERNPPFTSNMPELKKEQVKHALAAKNKNSTNKKPKENVLLGSATGQHQRKTQVTNAGGATHNSKLWCSFCDIRCPDEIAMAAHLNGRKHLAKLQEIMSFTSGTWALDHANMQFYQGI